jgi:hypothetical protein
MVGVYGHSACIDSSFACGAVRCGKIARLVAPAALGIETGDFPEEFVEFPGIPELLDAGVREVDPRASEAPAIAGRRWAVRASSGGELGSFVQAAR